MAKEKLKNGTDIYSLCEENRKDSGGRTSTVNNDTFEVIDVKSLVEEVAKIFGLHRRIYANRRNSL